MIFITLGKAKSLGQVKKMDGAILKSGIKVLGDYATLGGCDDVFIFEASNEKAAMKFAVDVLGIGFSSTETMVAIQRDEAMKVF